jgi:hypothetical protein
MGAMTTTKTYCNKNWVVLVGWGQIDFVLPKNEWMDVDFIFVKGL